MRFMSDFIATEPLEIAGEKAEQIVWNSLQAAFAKRDCLGYWRYPIFTAKTRKEPDILIADRDLGLIIVEVKALKIEQIASIQGHLWQYKNFYTESGNPYQQAVNQLYSLLKFCDREPILKHQVTAKALIALPHITEQEWQQQGFCLLPSNPPILFKDSLADKQICQQKIVDAICIQQGSNLTVTQWSLLKAVLAGTPVFSSNKLINRQAKTARKKIIKQAQSRICRLDLEQEKIAKQIPSGMQKIRGVAGSGKTILLCQKAALMSLKYPEWQVALVFFSRSLYEPIIEQVDRWIRYFSQERRQYDRDNSNLKILHAWGSKIQPGFYSTICNLVRKSPLSVNNTVSKQPQEALAEVCLQLLETTAIPQVFDAILIDEAQDLVVDNWRYRDKQPFYWLAYQSLRSVSPINPEQKRLVWAYDEMQALTSLKIPDAVELFGEDLGHLVTGEHETQLSKTAILTLNYRTPQQIMVVAGAIAIGFLRKRGLLVKLRDAMEWSTLGYSVTGELKPGNKIVIQYNCNLAANPVAELWQQDIIEFTNYTSRQQELSALADNIQRNLGREQLQPSQEILVIVLGNYRDAINLQQLTAKFLMRQGIDIYVPGSKTNNFLTDKERAYNPNLFWYPGAVTISTIHRAKGQEADLVYLLGLDFVARDEANIYLRNQLFIALTRSRGWSYLSGINKYEFYQELEAVIASKDTFKFVYREDFVREINICDRTSLLKGYATGRTNFRHANLRYTDLSYQNLSNINLIAADLTGANLTQTNLSGAKLIEANLTNANLTDANLTKAKLIGAKLKNAVLSGANIDKADLTNISF